MWSLSPPVLIALAATVAVASGASGSIGYKLGRASGDKDVRAMLEAGQKVLALRDKQIKVNLRMYREDIATANRRKPSSVYCGPNNGVPETPGGTAGAGAAESNRRTDGTDLGSHDYGPELRAARDALMMCNALIEVVK